jgi:hypothetical protein
MHPRDIILLQTAFAAAAIIVTYIFFVIRPPSSSNPRRHPTLRGHQRQLNLTELIGCGTPPDIRICIFARDAKRVRRLVQMLSSAGYGAAGRVSLTVVGGSEVVQNLDKVWLHDGYEFAGAHNMSATGDGKNTTQLVIALDDHMEPSPLHALWFLIQYCHTKASAIAGGGEGIDSTTGLAVDGAVWDGFAEWIATSNLTSAANNITQPSTALLIDYLSSSTPNASIVFPSIGGGNLFVRSEWQNPAYVEHAPKLTRTWNPEKEPSWGAVEIRL